MLARITNNSDLFFEFYEEFCSNSFFGFFCKKKNVLIGGSADIDKKIPVLFRNFDSSYTHPLASSIINEFTGTVSGWIFKVRSTRKPGGLFSASYLKKFFWGEGVPRGRRAWRNIKYSRYKNVPCLSFQLRFSIGKTDLFPRKSNHAPRFLIKYECLRTYIARLEPKTSCVANNSTRYGPRKPNPRNQSRDIIFFIELYGNRRAHFCSRKSKQVSLFFISSICYFYHYPFPSIKCKKTVRSACYNNNRELLLFYEIIHLREKMNSFFIEFKEISSRRWCFKGAQSRNINFGLNIRGLDHIRMMHVA